jgi:hypothetical protein
MSNTIPPRTILTKILRYEKKEQGVSVFQKMMPREIFGPKKE